MRFGPLRLRAWKGPGEAMATVVWPGRIGRLYQARWGSWGVMWGSVSLLEKPLYVSDILDAMKERA